MRRTPARESIPPNLPIKMSPEGLAIRVRVTPKGGATRVESVVIHAGEAVLKVRVSAPPEEGKANAALIEALAMWLNMPKSSFRVRTGQRSRLKSVSVVSDLEDLLPKMVSLLSQLEE